MPRPRSIRPVASPCARGSPIARRGVRGGPARRFTRPPSWSIITSTFGRPPARAARCRLRIGAPDARAGLVDVVGEEDHAADLAAADAPRAATGAASGPRSGRRSSARAPRRAAEAESSTPACAAEAGRVGRRRAVGASPRAGALRGGSLDRRSAPPEDGGSGALRSLARAASAAAAMSPRRSTCLRVWLLIHRDPLRRKRQGGSPMRAGAGAAEDEIHGHVRPAPRPEHRPRERRDAGCSARSGSLRRAWPLRRRSHRVAARSAASARGASALDALLAAAQPQGATADALAERPRWLPRIEGRKAIALGAGRPCGPRVRAHDAARAPSWPSAFERAAGADWRWAALGVVFEALAFAGYATLFWHVAGPLARRASACAAAPRSASPAPPRRACCPTAGLGGIALTLWALARRGLSPVARGPHAADLPRSSSTPSSWARSP